MSFFIYILIYIFTSCLYIFNVETQVVAKCEQDDDDFFSDNTAHNTNNGGSAVVKKISRPVCSIDPL